jgi:hypothetical protein
MLQVSIGYEMVKKYCYDSDIPECPWWQVGYQLGALKLA